MIEKLHFDNDLLPIVQAVAHQIEGQRDRRIERPIFEAPFFWARLTSVWQILEVWH